MNDIDMSKMEFGGFKHGDIVWWREEWADSPEELATPFVCLEPASDGRCFITPLDEDAYGKGTIPGTNMVVCCNPYWLYYTIV